MNTTYILVIVGTVVVVALGLGLGFGLSGGSSSGSDTQPGQVDQVLFDWEGEEIAWSNGDALIDGLGAVATLPPSFRVRVTSTYYPQRGSLGNIWSANPLSIGHYDGCTNGTKLYDDEYQDLIRINYRSYGNLCISFESASSDSDRFSYHNFRPNIEFNDDMYINYGDVVTIQLDVYRNEDKFYTTFTIKGEDVLANALSTFDCSASFQQDQYPYGIDLEDCDCELTSDIYKQTEKVNKPINTIVFPSLDAYKEGCKVASPNFRWSSKTTRVQVWSLK